MSIYTSMVLINLPFSVNICYDVGILGRVGRCMSFISKILDAFKLESTREMENTANNSAKHNEMSISEAYSETALKGLSR